MKCWTTSCRTYELAVGFLAYVLFLIRSTYLQDGLPCDRLFQGESRVLQFIGKWGYIVYEERDLIQQSIHMILSALFVIYIGSHASLRRPPSAAAPLESKAEEDDDLEFVEVEETIEGLSPLDAIIMPITAGLGLGGLSQAP
jgi:minor histocompatibility antigen H13